MQHYSFMHETFLLAWHGTRPHTQHQWQPMDVARLAELVRTPAHILWLSVTCPCMLFMHLFRSPHI